MPNWVYNSLTIEGNAQDIASIKEQLNKPFSKEHDSFDRETKEMKRKTFEYNNPVFAFWNIIKPTDMEAYENQPVRSEKSINDPDWWADTQRLSDMDNSWYNWNHRNWGTKWDVAVSDDEQYPETEITIDSADTLGYRFNTAWSPPIVVIETLSRQYPNLNFNLSYEEETGWGGEVELADGNMDILEDYESKCRDCDEINCLEYCENGCGEICSKCMYLGEADMECVKECEEHREFAPVD